MYIIKRVCTVWRMVCSRHSCYVLCWWQHVERFGQACLSLSATLQVLKEDSPRLLCWPLLRHISCQSAPEGSKYAPCPSRIRPNMAEICRNLVSNWSGPPCCSPSSRGTCQLAHQHQPASPPLSPRACPRALPRCCQPAMLSTSKKRCPALMGVVLEMPGGALTPQVYHVS